jgi:hypothetical protein
MNQTLEDLFCMILSDECMFSIHSSMAGVVIWQLWT